ncbi:MAG: arginine--tRNA ligase [Bdellovibrionales bacterium RIFOXYB1_FULL_37_110]|nr:MAG: arginine--tRNA ligase [Bdellovibrionales bacterium RIFOXYA1_FULL_38_20]OFZ49284.1 MAG: arginine--tRNA ligase [Bdellovibrionales bacterium RIFOXYC1_FULL_37_79]OFZ57745.1 MAG: arginine--tRNA ligase [Bdellovibrionales bacterium RIFOXYB1_FULL_37_110]OFZ61545.1 MAG: arginine--tRNA ligase [Bdellovibrionales bacterium RIFOXYD1_FULL_36_51]
MEVLHQETIKHIAIQIKTAIDTITSSNSADVSEIYHQLTTPPHLEMGHLAFPAFPLSKLLKKSPVQIAQTLASTITKSQFIEEIRPVGPYVNFFLNLKNVSPELILQINQGDFFKKTLIQNTEKIMIEYSQPNTHKILHVGHMRNLCLGNSLVRLNRYLGHQVIASTYPGDVGTHVAKCLWYLKYINKEALPTQNHGDWLGKIYVLASQAVEDQKDTEEESSTKQKLTEILRQLEEKKGEFYELWITTRQWSLDLFNRTYAWADVTFDRWYFESEVDSDSLKRVNQLKEGGLFIESQGAIGMDLSADNLGFCIVIKSDGTGMYSTKDIELAYRKFLEFGIDKSIYVVDNRQEFHFKQVFKVLEKIGFEHAKDCHHLQYDFVELPTGAMSSRSGNIIPLTDLTNQMEETIKSNFLNKYIGNWSDQEIQLTAHIIADGAIKYGMLKMDPNRKIVFIMDEWLKLDGDTGPYLQYVCARIHSMLEKYHFNANAPGDFALLNEPSEQALILKLMQFNTIIVQAAALNKPSLLCTFLYELAKIFNNFYAECPIGKADNPKMQLMRLHLSQATAKAIKTGLELLGIKTPVRM